MGSSAVVCVNLAAADKRILNFIKVKTFRERGGAFAVPDALR